MEDDNQNSRRCRGCGMEQPLAQFVGLRDPTKHVMNCLTCRSKKIKTVFMTQDYLPFVSSHAKSPQVKRTTANVRNLHAIAGQKRPFEDLDATSMPPNQNSTLPISRRPLAPLDLNAANLTRSDRERQARAARSQANPPEDGLCEIDENENLDQDEQNQSNNAVPITHRRKRGRPKGSKNKKSALPLPRESFRTRTDTS
jgi:hypothetical protein